MAGQGLFGPHLEITFESHLAPPYGGWLNAGQRGVRGATELICLRLNTKHQNCCHGDASTSCLYGGLICLIWSSWTSSSCSTNHQINLISQSAASTIWLLVMPNSLASSTPPPTLLISILPTDKREEKVGNTIPKFPFWDLENLVKPEQQTFNVIVTFSVISPHSSFPKSVFLPFSVHSLIFFCYSPVFFLLFPFSFSWTAV